MTMRRLIAIAVCLLCATPACADWFDYAFKFSSAAAAKADAQMLAGHYDAAKAIWASDHVLVGIECWRPSQDVAGVHTDLAGYFVLVSVASQAPIPALANDAALQFILNRTKREAGQAFVVKNNIGAILADIACQPMWQSSNPYGAFQ